MPSLIDSIANIIRGIFGSILAVFQTLFNAIIGVVETFFSAIGTTISGLAHTFEGLLKFLLSNIVVIGSLVAVFFAYTIYQQRNGKSPLQKPAGSKKIN